MPQISESADRIIISVNPKAGRTSPMLRAEELRDRLKNERFHAEIATDLDYVAGKANEWHKDGKLRALVGVGGDGTAAELVNRTEPLTPFAILPAGNANLIAKYYRIGKSPKRLAQLIKEGNTLTIDAGRANGRLFLVMIGVGFDADVVQRVHANREENYKKGVKKGGHVSNLSYIKPIWDSLKTYRFPAINVEKSDGTLLKKSHWAFIFNVNTYGWGMPLAPGANPSDGKLNHCLLKRRGVLAGGMYISFATCFGSHRFLSGVQLGDDTSYRLSADESVPYQLDGDPGGVLPVFVETVPNRCSLIVPANL